MDYFKYHIIIVKNLYHFYLNQILPLLICKFIVYYKFNHFLLLILINILTIWISYFLYLFYIIIVILKVIILKVIIII